MRQIAGPSSVRARRMSINGTIAERGLPSEPCPGRLLATADLCCDSLFAPPSIAASLLARSRNPSHRHHRRRRSRPARRHLCGPIRLAGAASGDARTPGRKNPRQRRRPLQCASLRRGTRGLPHLRLPADHAQQCCSRGRSKRSTRSSSATCASAFETEPASFTSTVHETEPRPWKRG